MAGLINKPAEPLEDDILKATQDGIEAAMNPQARENYERVVVAGMKVATKDGWNGMLRNLPTSKDPVRDCAIGGVNVAFMMVKSQGGQHQTREALLAATYGGYGLMLQALDVAQKIGVVKITNEEVARATKIATDRIFQNMQITPAMLGKAAGEVNKITKDPAKMEAIKLKIGASRDPRAPQPTLPETEEANGA